MFLTEDTLNDWVKQKGAFLITRRDYNVKDYNFEKSKQKNGYSYVCLTGYDNVLHYFFNKVIHKYSNKVIVIIIEVDVVPLKKEWLDHDNIGYCYTWNKPFHHSKLHALPIGLNYNRQYDSIQTWMSNQKNIKKNKKKKYHKQLLCMNYTPQTNSSRILLMNKAKTDWKQFCNIINFIPNLKSYYIKSEVEGQLAVHVTNPKCYDEWKQYKFVLSPQGTGLDTHRTWEAIIVGCIPIVLSSNLDELYKDLPIIVIESWDKLNKSFLEKEYMIIQKKKIIRYIIMKN